MLYYLKALFGPINSNTVNFIFLWICGFNFLFIVFSRGLFYIYIISTKTIKPFAGIIGNILILVLSNIIINIVKMYAIILFIAEYINK